ncbi:hypothetical protein [Phytobacter sp. RSE-02]|uniref:hypothetical protein n=1 Tax=Phytobacter sp. RSE-02 TaxID=3229229 RepID=UPI00339D83D5
MADAEFVLPKGVYQKYEYLFNILKIDVELVTDAVMNDIVLIYCMENWSMDDFGELIQALRLSICREQNLKAEIGSDILHWSFSSK